MSTVSKTLAIDFDGVIHKYSEGWKGGEIYDEPVNGTKEAFEVLQQKGYKIWIYSTRANKLYRTESEADKQIELMEAWLTKHQIPFDKIWTKGKPMANLYLDDRAVQFNGNWGKALHEVENFEVWNKMDKPQETHYTRGQYIVYAGKFAPFVDRIEEIEYLRKDFISVKGKHGKTYSNHISTFRLATDEEILEHLQSETKPVATTN